MNHLNQEIINYFSPWSSLGHEAKFGWQIRCYDIQSHIQRLDYVESISGLSILRIIESDDRQHYRFTDTVRDRTNEIHFTYPWSIAIPIETHLIEVVDEREESYWSVDVTGIDNLAIGSTFILSRSNHDKTQ